MMISRARLTKKPKKGLRHCDECGANYRMLTERHITTADHIVRCTMLRYADLGWDVLDRTYEQLFKRVGFPLVEDFSRVRIDFQPNPKGAKLGPLRVEVPTKQFYTYWWAQKIAYDTAFHMRTREKVLQKVMEVGPEVVDTMLRLVGRGVTEDVIDYLRTQLFPKELGGVLPSPPS
jgi:hypothetical protein